jgi:hypothetical protein
MVSVFLLLSACASKYDGVFEPACIAHAGDKITLNDGRFVWEKFTDEIRIDEHGNRIDPFPGYPIDGEYDIRKERVSLIPDGSAARSERYLLEYRKHLYLLTFDQNEAVLDGVKMPTCALRRVAAE